MGCKNLTKNLVASPTGDQSGYTSLKACTFLRDPYFLILCRQLTSFDKNVILVMEIQLFISSLSSLLPYDDSYGLKKQVCAITYEQNWWCIQVT